MGFIGDLSLKLSINEICRLHWEWELKIPEVSQIKVFIIPGTFVKNGEDRLVVCNDIARSVIESQRGKHSTSVFTYNGQPVTGMHRSAWRKARKRAGLEHVRIHDLKHSFGRRLRAAGVSFEDRQDLLGHRSGRITTHYSSAELQNLYEAANKVCEQKQSGVVLTAVCFNSNRKPKNQKQVSAKCVAL